MINQSVKREVQAILERDKDYVIKLTQDMVKIPTVNPKFETGEGLNCEADHQNFLEGVLKDLNFIAEQSIPDDLPGRPNLEGVWKGSQGRSLVLGGHIDVVPVGDLSKWTAKPFSADIKDGRIYGRGSLDMKAGLAAQIAACRAIKEAGLSLEGCLAIHAVVDEEAGGFGAIDLIKRTKASKGAIISEPTWGVINPCQGGLEWVRVTIRGRNAHAGWRYNSIYPQKPSDDRPIPGVNALEYGAMFIMALREFEREWGMNKYHPSLPAGITTINPGVMIAGAGMGADGRPEITNNPAIIPDTCIIEFDLKFLPSETKEQVRAEFEHFCHSFSQQYKWLQENPIEVKWELGNLHSPPVETSYDHPLIQSIINERKALGKKTELEGFVAVTDAAHYAGAGTDCIIYGPGGDGFHGIDEYVDIDSLIETSKVLACTVMDWCGVK